jgi:sulfur-oxidizing protein SoxA
VIARAIAAAALAALGSGASAQVKGPDPLRSGIAFESADLQRLQSDDFANPGMLWVAQGETAWNQAPANGAPPCAGCHGDARRSMRSVAARYPRFDPALGRVVDLEGRIDACHRAHQRGGGLAPESEARLALSAFVAHQSRGLAVDASAEGPARAAFAAGERLYHTRIGQLHLACTHCHDASWGKTLLAERISQGHPTAWPAYRLEWQSVGSLQRRIRACFFGVRAEQPAWDSEDLVALQLYLAVRARGLVLESPGVRR